MVCFSARSSDIASRAIVCIICRQTIRAKGRNAYYIVEGTRIISIVFGVIACSKNSNVSVQNIVVFGCFEIMDGIYFCATACINVCVITSVRLSGAEGT